MGKCNIEINPLKVDMVNNQNCFKGIFLYLKTKIFQQASIIRVNVYTIFIFLCFLNIYKGVYTSYWPIICNEKVSGVTLQEIDVGIDTGNIIAQETFKLGNRITSKQLYSKYIEMGMHLVKENFHKLISGNYSAKPIKKYYNLGAYII